MSGKSTIFVELEAKFADDPRALAERSLLVAAESICRAMDEQGITRLELARRMGVSRQYVTSFLNAPTNTTLETIIRFARAVGLEMDLRLVPTRAGEAAGWDSAAPPRPARVAGAA